MQNDHIGIIRAALKIIKEEQEHDGSFVTLSSVDPLDFSDARTYKTTFAASNIMRCLNALSVSLVKEIGIEEEWNAVRLRGADFLKSEQHEDGSFNYWSRSTGEYKAMPYPNDLDDTFVALDALYGYDKTLIDGKMLGKMAHILTKTEERPGGPYRTWLIGEKHGAVWKDVDVAVNSNIGSFLKRLDIQLPGIENGIVSAIRKEKLISPYYPGICQVSYAVSRFYRGDERGRVMECLLRARDSEGTWKNALESSLAILAMINLGFGDSVLEDDIANLGAKVVQENFLAHPLWIDPMRTNKKSYAGSRALTAAFVLEAMTKWIEYKNKQEGESAGNVGHISHETKLAEVKVCAMKICSRLPENLRIMAEKVIGQIEHEEVILVPYQMHEALGRPTLPNGLMESLACANLYGWIAYGIYDDLFDAEGSIEMLSTANIFLRELTWIYAEIAEKISGLEYWFKKLLDVVDDANVWEIMWCRAEIKEGILKVPERLPDDNNMVAMSAKKSIAHALPGIAVMLATGKDPKIEIEALIAFFNHYLTARQLHDDAHDWLEDMQQGRLTPISMMMIRAWHEKNREPYVDTKSSADELRKMFWQEKIGTVVKLINDELDQARVALGKCSAVQNSGPFERLCVKLADSAQRALQERDEALKFLVAYKGK